MATDLLNEIKRIKAIADIGLLYSTDEYDKERYRELQQISLQLLHQVSNHSIENLQEAFSLVKEYPTAKVDTRGLVLSTDKKILLVKEQSDRQWSLPGGWADIGFSPKENITKEIKEETGLEVTVKKLLAVFDKRKHLHPAHSFYVYKMVFYCEAGSSEIFKGFDVLDADYFFIDKLPSLSEERILKSQIELVYQKVLASDFETYFD